MKRRSNNIIRYTVFVCVLSASMVCGTGCHDDPEADKPAVENISFIDSKISMKPGERQAVKVEVTPAEARKYHPVEYKASAEGIVTISESSNNGCVLTAEKNGTVVIVAKAGGYTAYLEVIVDHAELPQVPYIMVPTQVIELTEGSRKSAQVTLFNGSAIDQHTFLWEVESGKDNISITTTGNTVVVQGEKRGSQKIIIRHPKSEYSAEILVLVVGVNEVVKYITTASNVITMMANGGNKQFEVSLVNGHVTDSAAFTFRILESDPCIDILSSNNTCNIMANRRGTAVIRAEHPLAKDYPLDVRVIVYEGEETYIEIDENFLMMDIGRGKGVTATLAGGYEEKWNNDFKFEIQQLQQSITVTQTNNYFYISPVGKGTAVLEFKNKHCEYSRELLIIVRDPEIIPPDEYYITTSQNVIQMEIGQTTASSLLIQLVNGTHGDNASFEWTVEDGRVIKVEAQDLPHGKEVNYLNRSMKNIAQAVVKSVENTTALVTPLKIGTTRIIISHPKSPYADATVIVKVYPRGTFANQPYILESYIPKSGLIKVNKEEPPTKVELKMASGDLYSIGDLNWKITNTAIADVLDSHNLENVITGKATGVTKLLVENNNLQNPYEATVMAGTEKELAEMSVLYTDRVYHTVAVGQSISIPILNSNMATDPATGILSPNALSMSETYSIEPYDKTKLQAVMIKNRLFIQGLEENMANPIILTIGNMAFNRFIVPAEVRISIVPREVSVDKPYTLTGPNFVGMLFNQDNVDVHVTLTDATAVEKQKVGWKSDNAAIVAVTGMGEDAKLKAGNRVSQTNITASHTRSVNDKMIVAYVVEKMEDLGKVVLGIEKDHWLLKPSEETVLQLITNADDTDSNNINKIKWNVDDDSVLDINYNGARALIRAKDKGSAVITVDHPNRVLPLKIYVSVSSMLSADKEITLPSIVEIIIGENKVITADHKGLAVEINDMSWSIDDPSVVSISGENGGTKGQKLFLQGRDRGQAWITAKLDSFGYMKKILVVCARTYDEIAQMALIASEESYYRMKVGESRDIRLIFGSGGFPEEKMTNITWKDEGNKVVKVYPNGRSAKIETVGLGITTVTVSCNDPPVLKSVSIMFESYTENMTGAAYSFNTNTYMVGLVTKKTGENENADNTKEIFVSIMPQGPSYATITAMPEDTGQKVFEYLQNSNKIVVTGKTKGQAYLRVKHAQVAEDLRILVYAADTKEELADMFPIALNKTNYMLTVGDTTHQFIKITTPNDDPVQIGYVTWSSNNTGIINTGSTTDKKQREIWSKSEVGNCSYEIKYKGVTQETAYISVKERAERDFTKRIVTENIIGMTPGETGRKTAIGSNLSAAELASLEWKSMNEDLVTLNIVAGDNGSRTLTAAQGKEGETEVIVRLGQIERIIKVYVHPDKNNYKALNMDNRYIVLRKNDEMTIQAFHAALGCSSDDTWEFYPQDNNVITKTPEGKDKLKIKGINEGIATLVLSNTDKAYGNKAMSAVTFHVEVNNTAPPAIESPADEWFMTAVKTLYAINQKSSDPLKLSVTPIRFPPEETAKIEWSVFSEETNGTVKVLNGAPPSLVQLYNKKGTFTELTPNKKIGKAVIRAFHPRSVNYIDFTVICDEDAVVEEEVPYIKSNKDIVKIKLKETAEVDVTLANYFGSYDIGSFTAVSDNTKVNVSIAGNKITVRGDQFGQALITVRHPKAEIPKKIIVMVMSDTDSLVYLTTKQNFVLVERNSYVTVSVEMVGFEDVSNSNYHWETADNDSISISASGKSAVISSKNIPKTAEVKVWNNLCSEYYLTIYVRITDAISANPVYITTNNNIVSLKEGNSIQIKANLVNGAGYELSRFKWQTADNHLIELNYSGDTAIIKGLKPGTAGITISHDSALNAITILAVIEPNNPPGDIYITTDSMLVEMSVQETQRLVRVRLVGGNPEDVYGFQWTLSSFSSLVRKPNDGTSYRVVEILGNADQCYVTPYRAGGEYYEGEATITVSHPKTSYKLDIKILLADKTDIKFAQSYLTMNQYEQKAINVSAPASGTIRYASGNTNIVEVTGTNKQALFDAKNEGQVIVTAYNQNNTKSDEIIVRVNPVDRVNYYYLWSDTSLVNLVAGGNSQRVSLKVKRAKDDTEDNAKTSSIRFRVKEGFYTKQCVKLGNATTNAWQSNANGEMVILPLETPGDVELEYYYYDNMDYKDCPNLKGVIKTIYVRVKKSDFTWAVSDHSYRMNEGTSQNVWARIDGVSNIDYSHNGDLTWSSVHPEIAVVNYTGTAANEGSKANIQAVKAGTTSIQVTYNGSTYSFPIVVDVNQYINSTVTSVRVTPATNAYFLLTSYPPDAKVTYQADSNMYADFYIAEGRSDIVGVEAIRKADVANKEPGATVTFRQMSPNFTCGQYGMWVKARGNDEQGTMNLVFRIADVDRRVNVAVTNMENNFVRWKTQAEARFQPNTPGGPDAYKLYYIIDPKDDELEWDTYDTSNFTVGTGSDENGKYVYFDRQFEDQEYYSPCITTVGFTTKVSRIPIQLNVFISYPQISPVWTDTTGAAWRNPSNSTFPAQSKSSVFDNVQYAVQIANGEQLKITLGTDPATPNSGIEFDGMPVFTFFNNDNKGVQINASGLNTVVISRPDNKRTGSAVITDIEYAGLMEVNYRYIRDGVRVTNVRRFFIYAMTIK